MELLLTPSSTRYGTSNRLGPFKLWLMASTYDDGRYKAYERCFELGFDILVKYKVKSKGASYGGTVFSCQTHLSCPFEVVPIPQLY